MASSVRVLGFGIALGVGGALMGHGAPAHAQAAAPSAGTDPAAPQGTAEPPAEEAGLRFEVGPKLIALGHGISLDLPETHAYLPQPDAGKLMEKMGNLHNEDL